MISQCLKLSAFAAQTLIDAGELNLKDLDPHSGCRYRYIYINVHALRLFV